MGRAEKQAQDQATALGILQGALWAVGCDPARFVWSALRVKLGLLVDPVGAAREAVRVVRGAEEHVRVLTICCVLESWHNGEAHAGVAL